jgi:hypothetical protein
MATGDEKRRRKELRRQLRAQERTKLEAGMPLSHRQLRALFDHLDAALAEGCEHDLRLTRAWLRAKKLDEARIVPWLMEMGGGCDCEVLGNVEDRFPAD